MTQPSDTTCKTSVSTPWRVAELVAGTDLFVRGDADVSVTGACALLPGKAGHMTFAERAAQAEDVVKSQADVAILPGELAERFTGTAIVTEQPRLVFARLAARFENTSRPPGIDARAVIGDDATIDPSAYIAAQVVIGRSAHIGAGVVIEPGAVIGDAVTVGPGSRIGARAVLGDRVRIGKAALIAAGAVIGERGFGLVAGPGGLEPVPQLASVVLGDNVEVGANSTIDRGALTDTVIGDGVKIDNQVHIAHNCRIGAHTVIAGCTGIAGSCVIGTGCMIGGGVGIGDHVTIADGVTITAASQVPKNIAAPGVYSSTFRAMAAGTWRRRLALFRALDKIEARLSRVEDNQ